MHYMEQTENRYYSSKVAYELSKWVAEENNRIKASRIARVAERIDRRYLDHRCNVRPSYGMRPKPPVTRWANVR